MPAATAQIERTSTRIPIGSGRWLDADITTPVDARGLVIFAHGSGSSRLSPRNRYVASELNTVHMATILADLLTGDEERVDQADGSLRFNIALLTERLVTVLDWARSYNLVGTLPIGVFGASTGSAAALDAAALRSMIVRAVVSRGGRPDLAQHLANVKAPTLLIVGGADTTVLQLNERASRVLRCTRELEVIPGATHLFEEPGALEAVAFAAGAWFRRYLAGTGTAPP